MRNSSLLTAALLCLGSVAHAGDTNIHPAHGRSYAPNYTYHQPGGLPAIGVNVASGLVFGYNNGELWSGTAQGIHPVSSGVTTGAGKAAAGPASAAALAAPVLAPPEAHLLALGQAKDGRYAFALSVLGKSATAPDKITLEIDKRAGALRWRVPELGKRWQSAPVVEHTLPNSGGEKGVSAMAKLPRAFASHGIAGGESHLRFLYDSRSKLQVDVFTHRAADRAQQAWTYRGTSPRATAVASKR